MQQSNDMLFQNHLSHQFADYYFTISNRFLKVCTQNQSFFFDNNIKVSKHGNTDVCIVIVVGIRTGTSKAAGRLHRYQNLSIWLLPNRGKSPPTKHSFGLEYSYMYIPIDVATKIKSVFVLTSAQPRENPEALAPVTFHYLSSNSFVWPFSSCQQSLQERVSVLERMNCSLFPLLISAF